MTTRARLRKAAVTFPEVEEDAIVESPAQPGSDLPASIGRAATRALATAGLITLEQVAAGSKADLLALHGVGPKAVRILVEALAERGLSLH